MAAPILNPSVPGTFALPFGVRSGLQIAVNGLVKHKKDFVVNLISGGNIALHVNFRFEKQKIVAINAKIDNAWGNEISHANPLHHDQAFDLQIRVYPGYFHITTNGVLLGDFPHRLPFESIQAINLEGKVHINNVQYSQFH
ncbi:Galectin [Caenorhabditis elegans]|uniref:Galectin n=1 Tax=Caenorhabditis elegans TaxID=6239 RepID=G5EC10_CAEEL|nr:Galectin [Caenorhabditis elegans]BAB11965.1 galectin LEC-9 [Caenorhabditis elegans]CCD64782.1 Galectin [Caenorhabditis elegans]|eukprot:NP_510844.1 Galectin [Caenorhabditis elegans]